MYLSNLIDLPLSPLLSAILTTVSLLRIDDVLTACLSGITKFGVRGLNYNFILLYN